MTIVTALVPIFLVIAAGWVLRRRRFLDETFWPMLDRVVYIVLFPAMLLSVVSRADLGGFDVAPLGGATLLAMLAMTAGLMLARLRWRVDGPAFTSVVQGAVRFSNYAAFSVAAGLYGDAGITVFSIVAVFAVIAGNVISVTVLAVYADAERTDWRDIAGQLARNPLLLAVIAGVLLNLSGVGLPWIFGPTLEIAAAAALPMGLLAVGAGLDIGALRRGRDLLFLACGLRLVAMPVLALGATWLFDIDGLTRAAVLIYATAPVAPSAYILARQLGGDAELMSGIITGSTLFAAVTMPVWFALLL